MRCQSNWLTRMEKMILMMIRIKMPIISRLPRIMRGMAQIGMASGAAVGIVGVAVGISWQSGGRKVLCEPSP